LGRKSRAERRIYRDGWQSRRSKALAGKKQLKFLLIAGFTIIANGMGRTKSMLMKLVQIKIMPVPFLVSHFIAPGTNRHQIRFNIQGHCANLKGEGFVVSRKGQFGH
jgi:hypothetical protein